jgi:hypothetical protein|tara:strand:+ start:719 stop:1075 length:357 start_codon:yes stop_codon:yes gene_type:complete
MYPTALDLDQFYGSATFTRWTPLYPDLLTEGCEYVAETANAYWLFDTISSHLPELDEDMVVSVLTVKDDSATLALTDGNDAPLRLQTIEFTDFPEGQIVIWSIKNELRAYTHMLPREY